MNITQIINMPQSFTVKNNINSLFVNKEVVILYYPELESAEDGENSNTNLGKTFVNKLRKKGIFNEVLLLPIYNFMNRTLNASNYNKEFRELNPNVKVVSSFKTFTKGKINLIDLSVLSELYFLQTRSFSKFKLTYELINLFNKFIEEYSKEGREFYLFIDSSKNEIDNIFIDSLFKIARKNSFKFKADFLKINGGLINRFNPNNQEYKFYPILQKKDKELLFKLNTFALFKKDYKIGEDAVSEDIDMDGSDDEILNKITSNGKLDKEKELNNIRKNIEDYAQNLIKKTDIDDIINNGDHQEKLDKLYEILNGSIIENTPGNTPLEKLENLFKDKDQKTRDKIKKLIIYLEEINKRYNGSLKLNYKLINESGDSYFDPKKIIKLDELTGYKKHNNEFDDILDHAMFDLIKSIEKDKEIGVNVLNIKTDIYDTNKSRYKRYIITLKNTKGDNKKVYTKEIVVPYPIKEKYFKIDGVNYIMLNQFYPKPILKVKPNMVRLYTHYSTSTVWLTTHIINEHDDINEIFNAVTKISKNAKIEFIESDKLNNIIEDFGLEKVNKELIFKKIEF